MNSVPNKFYDKFDHNSSTDVDIKFVMESHFSHVKLENIGGVRTLTSKGMYDVKRKLARYLLWNLKHSIPTSVSEITTFHEVLQVINISGSGGLLTEGPVIIDTNTNTILDGSKRLLAVALGKTTGVYFEFKFV